jgi:tetratricopeptide (TPR) repeat protein
MLKKNPACLTLMFVVLGLANGCRRFETAPATAATTTKSNERPVGYFQTQFQDESQFILEAIISDLVEEVFYAKYHRLPDPRLFAVRAYEKSDLPTEPIIFRVECSFKSKSLDLQQELKIEGPIWSADLYTNVTLALAEGLGVKPSKKLAAAASDTGMLEVLGDGKASTIETENQKLSKALEKDFTNPVLHEKAAVLLGAFALREHSGTFCDTRSVLCRMTAHLAVARYLSGKNAIGINGQFAEAMLLTLMNNEVTALQKLDIIRPENAALASWVRALRARNTSDYRALNLKDPSQVEAIEWFHALYRCVNTDIAWNMLNDTQKTTVDFVRIANEGVYSVGMGHELLQVSLPLEGVEMAATFKFLQDKQFESSSLVKILNQMPERCFSTFADKQVRVQIIGRGQWAMFFQRHLCHAVQHNFNFMDDLWGVPEEARKFSAECDQKFGNLRLYPFVRRFNGTNFFIDDKSLAQILPVLKATPQIVPVGAWKSLNDDVARWFRHDPPIGTADNPHARLNLRFAMVGPSFKAWLDKWRELAPYDPDVSAYVLRWGNLTTEQIVALYDPVLPYAAFAMEKVASTALNQPARYEELLSKAAVLNPSDYFKLGDYFVERKQDVLAAKYHELGNEFDQDAVLASNHAAWLVEYYLKIGETNKARLLADGAAQVYSFGGMCAKAQFLEAVGDYTNAFEWFSRMEERYDDPKPVIGFCARYKTKTGGSLFDDELKKRSAGLFPRGFEKAALADFQQAPTDGVLVRQENDLVKNAGLAAGNVIVAVYGIRVHNFAQYVYGRETSPDPELNLVVWQRNHYAEIKASPPNHRFGVDFGDYLPR